MSKPEQQLIIDELQQQVTSPEDQTVVDQWQEELNAKRQKILSTEKHTHIVDASGVVLTEAEIEDIRKNGPAETR